MRRGAIAVCAGLILAGCGSSAVDGSASDAPPYAGPLTAQAAVAALECDGRKPYLRVEGDYDGGLESVRPSPQEAFDDYVESSWMRLHVPIDGYRIERRDEQDALLSFDVRDRTKVAVVVSDGIRDWNRDEGWGVVAWAQCDPAEFPPDVSDALNVGIWTDVGGDRVPATRVRSFQGPEHCDWTGITFLVVGGHGREPRGDWYLRDTTGELAPLLHGSFDRVTELPAGATDTGWRRDGRRLWIAADETAAYLVDVDDPRDIERWPREKEPIGCA